MDDVQHVEQLPLVLVHTLYLHIEHELRRYMHAFLLPYNGGKLRLLLLLYGVEGGYVSIRRIPLELRYLGQVGYKAAAYALGDELGKLTVAEAQPAALGNAVGLVLELIGSDRVPILKQIVPEYIAMYLGHAVHIGAGKHCKARHVYLTAGSYLHAVYLLLAHAPGAQLGILHLVYT